MSLKALVPAGGRGNRLNELSSEQNKCMIRLRDKPLIEHNLDCAVDIDVAEIVVVVGYKAETIINHLGNNYRGKTIRYVIQSEQKGLVHAIECAANAIGGSDFVLMLADEMLLRPRHRAMMDEFRRDDSVFGICGVIKVHDRSLIKRTYTFIQNERNEIFRLVEKPRNPLNDFQGTGQCVFRNGILDYIGYTPIHHERHEKELPDLIQCAIDDGKLIKSFIVCEKYTNINTYDDIELAESFFDE